MCDLQGHYQAVSRHQFKSEKAYCNVTIWQSWVPCNGGARGGVECRLRSPPEVSFFNGGIIANRPCNAVLLTFWQVCKNGEFRHKICMTVSQLVLQHTRAKVNESASDIRLSIIMLNHEHPPAGDGRRGKNGVINPKSESLLFKTSISALKPFTFPRRSAHLYMNGLLSCRRPLNSSMAVSWGLSRSYEWDRRPRKLIQDSVCCSHLPVVVSRKERGLHLLACELSASIWSMYLFLSTGFIYLSQNMRQGFDS